MRPGRVRDLRQETVQMFYHGFDNYMEIAFPEDEVWPNKTMPQSCLARLADLLALAPPGFLRPALSRQQEPP